eukprot:13922030-Heterocapsa_arctica.AAC.1
MHYRPRILFSPATSFATTLGIRGSTPAKRLEVQDVQDQEQVVAVVAVAAGSSGGGGDPLCLARASSRARR